MTRQLSVGILLATSFLVVGCGGGVAVLATYDGEKILQDEFEESFAKNNGGWDAAKNSTAESRQNYLDLMLKFKLKVKEARDRGLDRDTAVQNELASYRSTIAQTYMLDREIVQPAVKMIYERKKEELRASHVLILVGPSASPAETLRAYNKALDVIRLIPSVPFDSLAIRYSEDPTAATNHGDIGWFSTGRMVPEFEDASYALAKGEYTKTPARTKFGYHVIKVFHRQTAKGQANISHVLLKFNSLQSDTAQVRDTAWAVYSRLKAGRISWSEAVKKYSQDASTAIRNGEIGMFERERLPAPVGDAVWSLSAGEYTTPIGFSYGYHIVRATMFQSLPPFEESEKQLRQQYQEQRYPQDLQKYTQALCRTYNVAVDRVVVEQFKSFIDSSKAPADSAWGERVPADLRKKNLLTYIGGAMTTQEFMAKLKESAEFAPTPQTQRNVDAEANRFVEMKALEEHAKNISSRHPAFAALMGEYEEGVLLYRIEQDEIWKKVVVNDSLLRLFYEDHKQNYRWPNRVSFSEIFVVSDSALNEVKWRLAYEEDFLQVAFDYTARAGYKEKKGVWGFQPYDASELSKLAASMAVDSVSSPVRVQGGWSIVKTLAKDSARVKLFEEAGPELASAYQDQSWQRRQTEWVESLKQKYPITIDRKILPQLFTRPRNAH